MEDNDMLLITILKS